MRLLILLALIATILSGFTVEGIGKLNLKVESTLEDYQKAPKHGFYDNKDNPATVYSGSLKGSYENLDYKIVISNLYDDTYIDTVALETNHRYGNLLYGSKIGTISTLKGIFDLQKTADEQAPLIGGTNAIYTNRLRKAGYEQTTGVEPYVGFVYKGVLAKVRYNYSHMRMLSASKMNIGILGYDSDYTQVEVAEPFQGAGFTVLFDGWDFFYDDVSLAFKLKQKGNLSQTDMFMLYMSNPANFDTSLLAVDKGISEVQMIRYGFTKQTTDFLFGYEYILYSQINKEISSDKGNYAHSYYLAYYGIQGITPYSYYGYSQRLKEGKKDRGITDEYALGVRIPYTEFLTFLVEHRKTGWWQVEELNGYRANRDFFANDGHPIEMTSLKAILKF